MEDIYIIEYLEDGKKTSIAILEDIKLVDIFMSTTPWTQNKKTGEAQLNFVATHYKKEPCGVLQRITVLDYSHLRPLPRIRIPRPSF
jgi:hypothetical protein